MINLLCFIDKFMSMLCHFLCVLTLPYLVKYILLTFGGGDKVVRLEKVCVKENVVKL